LVVALHSDVTCLALHRGSMQELFKGIGCLVVLIAFVASVASIPMFGPVPIAFVFGVGYALYKSNGKLF